MFDSKTFLTTSFREPARVRPMFKAYGIPGPSDAAVTKWFQRGTVPSDWLPLMLCLLELETGKPVSLVKYLRTK